jgi:hypothetical protein
MAFWIWTVEIHFGSLGLRENQNSNLAYFSMHFYPSCGSDDTWLWLINDSDPFRAFGTSALQGFLSTSHFKSPEAHFPEGLDQLPPVPFKINDSYSLRGLLFWRYTSRKFSLPNVREPLIWTVPGIFTAERLKLSFAYASISKQTV